MPALEQHLIYRNRILTYSRLLMQLYCTCDKIFVVIIFIQNYTVLGRFQKQLLLRAGACLLRAGAFCCGMLLLLLLLLLLLVFLYALGTRLSCGHKGTKIYRR